MSANCSRILDFSGNELNEEDVKNCVTKLRELVLEDEKLANFRRDDEYLRRFLHSTHFDVAAALKKMQDFCELLVEYPDWFGKVPPLDKKTQIEKYDKALLRERDKNGRSVLVVKLGKMDVINSHIQEQAQILETWMESIMDDPKTQATGLSVIVDMSGYSWRLFKWLTPSNIKIAVKRIEAYPLTELLLHVVNTSFLLSATIKLLWPFFNDKMKSMFKFHFVNWSSLHEYISPEVLPSEYNGTSPDIHFEKSAQLLFDRNAEIKAKLEHYTLVLQR